jgi:hypothetical protein
LHEVLDGGRIGIAADDIEPGASKRARHAHSHRAKADHRRVTSNSSVHCSHWSRMKIDASAQDVMRATFRRCRLAPKWTGAARSFGSVLTVRSV